MKKFKLNVQRDICILLCLILYITVLPLSVSEEEATSRTVRVGWYEGTDNTTGPDGQRRGYSYEYQQAVAAHTGWKYEYVEGSWAELMSMLKKGEIDLLGGISYAEERSDSMFFSELPIGEDKYYLYVDTSNTDISTSDLTILNGKRIGMLPDALPAKMFHEWEKDNISAVLLIGGSFNYFAVSKKCPDLKKELDQAMQKIMKENPFYTEDLCKRYRSSNSIETLTDEEQSCLGENTIEFQMTGFDSQEEELQALKDNRIDMIFHMNQNPYEAEQNDIILSNTVFEVNVAVLTGVEKFDENKGI